MNKKYMCGNCKDGACKGNCLCSMIAKILVIIGGVNWGLIGLGMLLGKADWNVVHMILGGMPIVEGIVYLLVGVSAIVMIFGCKCGKCKDSTCCSVEDKKEEVQMPQ